MKQFFTEAEETSQETAGNQDQQMTAGARKEETGKETKKAAGAAAAGTGEAGKAAAIGDPQAEEEERIAEELWDPETASPEEMQPGLIFRVVGREDFARRGVRTAHLDVLNLTIEFACYRSYIRPGTVPDYPGHLTDEDFVPVTEEHLAAMGISAMELFELCQESMIRALPPRGEKLVKLTGLAGSVPDNDMFVLTNSRAFYGAGAIFYPGVLANLSRIMETGFYVIPSSVQEVILLPEISMDISVSSVNGIIRDINRSDLTKGQVLSDTLYYYDRVTDMLWYA